MLFHCLTLEIYDKFVSKTTRKEKFAFGFPDFKFILENLVPVFIMDYVKCHLLLPVSRTGKIDTVKDILCIYDFDNILLLFFINIIMFIIISII